MKNKYILTIAGLLLTMSSLFIACETSELPDDPPKKIPTVPIIGANGDFTSSDTIPYEGQIVNFTSISNTDIYECSWSFPGGSPSSSTSKNPSVVYNIVGNYNVSLNVKNSKGETSLTKTNFIRVRKFVMEGSFYCSNTTPNPNQNIIFTSVANTSNYNCKWTFTGGTPSSSTSKSPTISYSDTGYYPVSLIVYNSQSADTVSIPNYIHVKNKVLNGYDTLNYPMNGTPALYELGLPNKGFITGNNSYGDKAKAQYFFNYNSYNTLVGVYCWFGYATGNNATNIEFAAWDKNSSGKPNNKIASKTETLGNIKSDINGNYLTYVEFNSPISISNSFFAGIVLPTTTGDTVAIMSNTNGQSNPTYAWELNSANNWLKFDDPGSWKENGLLQLYIFPVVANYSKSTNKITHKEILMPIRINKKITKAKK